MRTASRLLRSRRRSRRGRRRARAALVLVVFLLAVDLLPRDPFLEHELVLQLLLLDLDRREGDLDLHLLVGLIDLVLGILGLLVVLLRVRLGGPGVEGRVV